MMDNKLFAIRILSLFILTIVGFSSCRKNEEANPSRPSKTLGETIFPKKFNFSTYQDISLQIDDAANGVYGIIGRYGLERDILSKARAVDGYLNQDLHIPKHYTRLALERYAPGVYDTVSFSLNGEDISIQYDFNKTGKTSALPTDVLYAVNSQKDFMLVDLNDFSTTTLPDLLQGTIACAVDTISDYVYYHKNPNMYTYDLNTNTHSVSGVNPNPFNGNYPRMEFDHSTGHLFISSSTTIHEVDPISGNTVNTYSIQGIVNSSAGGDLAFPPNGKKYLACFSGLYELTFPTSGNVVQAIRLSAENMPYQLTSMGYDRNSFLYAATNNSNSKLLKMDPNDGSFIIVKTFPVKINDLGSVVSLGSSVCTVDSDNDGICDELDDHPQDPEAAFDEYTPSELGYGSIAYEDMWPGEGDYDYNDLVVGYRYIQVLNSNNELVRLELNYVVRAVGASFNNGFGFQLNIDPSIVSSVTGGDYSRGIVSLDGQGFEASQTTPTIIVFENAFDVIDHVGGAYINTDPNYPISYGDTVKIVVNFIQPQSNSNILPENPFIFVDGNRGHEIHLADGLPTDLVDPSLFGTQQDDSNPSSGRYYRDNSNVPWAIEVSHTFRHPVEKSRIDQAYNHFVDWGKSAGITYPDWYKDNTGYRNSSQLISF